MCNKKNEGGRCHAHLKEEISRLSALDSEQSYTSALAAGVSIDKEAFEAKLVRIDADVEKEEAEHKQKLQSIKDEMMDAHANALDAKNAYENQTLTAADAVDKVKGIFKRQDDVSETSATEEKEILEDFAGYEHVGEYIEAQQYPEKVDQEMRKTREAFQQAKTRHEAQLERDALKGNLALRAQKRRLRYERVKEVVSADFHTLNKMENEYAMSLKTALAGTENSFAESDECKFYQKKLKRLDAEYFDGKQHSYEQEKKLAEHWAATGYRDDVHGIHQGRLTSRIRRQKRNDTSNYEKSRAKHYAWKFKKLKNEYVEAANTTKDYELQREAKVSALKKRPPLQSAEFKQHRENVYAQSAAGKEINARITAAKKELVLTPTYRGQLKAHIKQLMWDNKDASEPLEKLRKLEKAAEAMGKKPLNLADMPFGVMSRD